VTPLATEYEVTTVERCMYVNLLLVHRQQLKQQHNSRLQHTKVDKGQEPQDLSNMCQKNYRTAEASTDSLWRFSKTVRTTEIKIKTQQNQNYFKTVSKLF